MKIDIDYFFRDQLTKKPGISVREPQIKMSLEIDKAFKNNRVFACEAEVGTGKSFAYLVPGVKQLKNTGKPLIISTGTIVLQDQLIKKDIRDLSQYFMDFGYLTTPLRTYIAKGKENYFCPKRFSSLIEKEISSWVKTELQTASTEDMNTNHLYKILSAGLDYNLFTNEELALVLNTNFELFETEIYEMIYKGYNSGIYTQGFINKYIPYDLMGAINKEKVFNCIWHKIKEDSLRSLGKFLVEGLVQRIYQENIKEIFKKGLRKGVFNVRDLAPLIARTISSFVYTDVEITHISQKVLLIQATYQNDYFDYNDFNVGETTWEKINVRSCTKRCREEGCLYRRHKGQRTLTHNYDILVCNHHYLLSWVKDANFSINNYAGIIIDEAHNLENAAYSIFGLEYEKRHFLDFINNVYGKIKAQGLSLAINPRPCIKTVNNLFDLIKNKANIPENSDTNERYSINISRPIINVCHTLNKQLDSLYNDYYIFTNPHTREDYLENTFNQLLHSLNIIEKESDDYIFWVEINKSNNELVFKCIPQDINSLLKKYLFDKEKPIILTSATLSSDQTEEGFDYFLFNTGIDEINSKYYKPPISLKSPYDYSKQAGLYIDREFYYVSPKTPDYDAYLTNIAAKMFKILQLTKGKALILFTSYYSMDFTYDYLAPKLKAELSIDSFKQGMESKKVLLERFSANINACLFATGSFWEGIDIKGPSLSYVIIHKLPFPVMDPVITYKLEKMKEVIGEDVQLTQMEMMLRLKQGAGRLIRDEFDKGVLVIMDIRAANKYKELIIKNLPSFKYLNNFEELKTFIAKLP